MTKNAIRGNNRAEITSSSYNLEVSRPESRRQKTFNEPKRYAVKTVSKQGVVSRNGSKVNSHKKSSESRSQAKKTVAHKSVNKREGNLFKYLMVIMGTIVMFGGLGFGYTLRYANQWQGLMSDDSGVENTFTGRQDVINQEAIKEMRVKN